MSIEKLYEDEYIIAINKPSGLTVHSDGRSTGKTLADWILEEYPDLKNVGEPLTLSNGNIIFRPGIVHRLDKETSGVLVIAKTPEAFLFLKKQFQSREVKKTYRAIVYGAMKQDTGLIEKPIGKSRSDFRKWSAEYGARGVLREAVTEYKVLARGIIPLSGHLGAKPPSDFPVTYLEVCPKTGRTHQIRVHLKAIGYPVVCDSLYAKGKPCPHELGRLALHARSLELALPTGKRLKIEAPFPDDFLGILSSAFHISIESPEA
ncbi:MAG: RluA family pseudouridine synthase [Candidatus Lloydbacteria bacterium]|nr:RluA family pseudouridine synthase [Candidatus Lloydbacteria bacterium]